MIYSNAEIITVQLNRFSYTYVTSAQTKKQNIISAT